jgi:hypothetical protein
MTVKLDRAYVVSLKDKSRFPRPVLSSNDYGIAIGSVAEQAMSRQEYEAEIAAFIRVTRCPTAFAAPTHGSNDPSDRAALRQRAEHLEVVAQERTRQTWSPVVVAA